MCFFDDLTHVVPNNDLREHICEGTTCWCHPELDEEYGLVVHKALDGREKFETGERKLS